MENYRILWISRVNENLDCMMKNVNYSSLGFFFFFTKHFLIIMVERITLLLSTLLHPLFFLIEVKSITDHFVEVTMTQ